MAEFYTLHINEFVKVPVRQVRKGDRIAWGTGSRKADRYGVLLVQDVTVTSFGVMVQYTVSPGAMIQSTASRAISVFWEGNKPLIKVSEDFDLYAMVLIKG